MLDRSSRPHRSPRQTPAGRVIRRYEHPTPGDLVHVDVKKLGKIPDRGGWRMSGRAAGTRAQAYSPVAASPCGAY